MTRQRMAAAATALILCGQYLAAEAIAAAAWLHPYSYAKNYISDLGVTGCATPGVCSPRAAVMNGGFVFAGVLAVVAAALAAPFLRRGYRELVMGLAAVHAAGSVVVGLIHSAPGTPAGTPRLHLVGAYAAIVGGNLALAIAGSALRIGIATAAFRWISVAVGAFGLCCGLGLVATRGLPPGLLERGAVDTITIWEVGAGALLAHRLVRGRVRPRV